MKVLKFNKYSNKNLSYICENFESLYNAGIHIISIFDLLEELNLRKNYIKSISGIKLKVRAGSTLEDSFKEYSELYPNFFISMIAIGEKTGKLVDVLTSLKLYYGKMYNINKILFNALTYPIILIVSMVFISIFFVLSVIPSFADIYLSIGKEVPSIFKNLLFVRDILYQYPILSIVASILWFILIPFLLISYVFKEKIKYIIYRIPMIKRLSEYLFIVLLGIVVSSGISLSLGLQYCAVSKLFDNVNLQFAKLNEGITGGDTIADTLIKIGGFSKSTIAYISLGEKSGELDNRLKNLEERLFNNFWVRLNKYLQFLGPALILIVGALILVFIFIFILPLFDVFLGGSTI